MPSRSTDKNIKALGLPIASNIANSFILSKVVINIVFVEATKAVLTDATIIITCKLFNIAINEY
jgi:hypothetical protein